MAGGVFKAMGISSSGMTAQRRRMDVLAMNLSNAHSTRGPGGQTYRRMQVVFETIKDASPAGGPEGGVRVSAVVPDMSPLVRMNAPGHPDAVDGVVEMPNVDPVIEMTDLVSAARSYEANVAAFRASRDMIREAIRLWS